MSPFDYDSGMNQGLLFPAGSHEKTPHLIPGFSLVRDYISQEYESELIANLKNGPWENDWQRRIQQYGLGYGAQLGGKPKWLREFPAWLLSLARKVQMDAGFERLPDNCVINEYIPPLGIGQHKDYSAFGSIIACVSLGSDIVLDFTEPTKDIKVPVFVPSRSLWTLRGEARFEWMHGIASRLNDVINDQRRKRGLRFSVTFRAAAEQ
jgi:alkylated DNA repair dioxygenase AlkB